jgi:hypothetical protein
MSYHFGAVSFSNFVWIQNGALFSNVEYVAIEVQNTGAIRLEVVDQAGKVIGTEHRDIQRSGWQTFNFFQGNMKRADESDFSKPYKLRLMNAAGGGVRFVKLGEVRF